MDVHSTVLAGPRVAEPPAVFVHGVMSWGDDDLYGFGRQRPLAAVRRLVLMDRRGHGRSPDLEGPYRTDYEIDTCDVVTALGGGAHLVGHSYGGVAALLAASARPDLVRSLCLIQPGSMRVADEHPVVARMLERARAAVEEPTPDLTAAEYLRLSTESVGMPAPEPTPRRLRTAWTSMGERPCWDAPIDLAPIADAGFPVMVVLGDWVDAPAPYRELVGEPLTAAARVLAEKVGGGLLTVPGYYPHVQQAEQVNDALRRLWARA